MLIKTFDFTKTVEFVNKNEIIILLKEKIRFHRTAALIIGFLGIMVIIRPGYVPIETGTILLLFSAFTFSFVLIIVKKLSSIDDSQTIIFYHLLFSTPIFFIYCFFFLGLF